jgi:glutaredoxin-related protein
MKFLSVLALASLGFGLNAFAQQDCEGHLIDNSGRVVEVFRNDICRENLKACGLAARKTGYRCERVSLNSPVPPQYPQQPPQYPQQPPQYPQQPPQYPNPPQYPGSRLPIEVERMSDFDRAINFVLQDCYVIPNVSGWANQLYVRGQFSGNFDNSQEMQLRRAIRDLQSSGQCLMKDADTLSLQFDPNLINDAVDYSLSRNCYVLPNVSGWANQLYVDGQFVGNFDARNENEQMKLRSSLASYLVSGKCVGRSNQERQLLHNPHLIQDFANYQYRGCYVKLGVSGWANQLYVNGQFNGNFDQNSEVQKLQKTLVDLVMNRTCVYDPM